MINSWGGFNLIIKIKFKEERPALLISIYSQLDGKYLFIDFMKKKLTFNICVEKIFIQLYSQKIFRHPENESARWD